MASSSKMRLMAYEDSPVLILTLLLLLVDLMVGYYDDSLLSWLLDQVMKISSDYYNFFSLVGIWNVVVGDDDDVGKLWEFGVVVVSLLSMMMIMMLLLLLCHCLSSHITHIACIPLQ